MSIPTLLVADKQKKIYDLPGFAACGMANDKLSRLEEKDLIPLPRAAKLFCLPDRYAFGFNISKNDYQVLSGYNPVAVFVPPGYTQLFNTAYREAETARLLPLFSYAAVAWHKNGFYIPALQVDKRKMHNTSRIEMKQVRAKIQLFKKTKNRLISHLKFCALESRCPNAINFFLARYEGPLPVSSVCNARCIGCISYQPQGSCPATQSRIQFTPAPEEVAEVGLLHLTKSRNPVVSFGQGCEGEPLLALGVIKEAIKLIRSRTKKGTINLNTNASMPQAVEELCKCGLDSLRVSLNSAREKFYLRYYRPRGYAFSDVLESIAVARHYRKFVSLNYLVMPGFTDEEAEFNELVRFIRRNKPEMIQWRNLNYDPLQYFRKLGIRKSKNLLGIKQVITQTGSLFPELRQGYFNLPLRKA